MRLVKLDLIGFKSFAHRTELVFGDGITAVIGPNGSGKSNIADAVRWVLGEQSAKALRGAKMEDVIFGGTQQKKALSYCEVTLTFDNADHKLPIEFAEVAVTRRVYRSGESEYCINKNPCRLRDIADLFHDTGIGKDGYSIIGQGKVDEILANRSNDRRTALEEAAGVMRYRVRKEEAERKLESTGKNLERIEDILAELFARLGPLEEQSRAAREFLKLRDELRDLEINLFLAQYERMNERLAAIAGAMREMAADAARCGEREQALLSQCAEAESRARTLDAELFEMQNALMAMLAGVETHTGECNVLIERRDNAAAERARLSAEREKLLGTAAELSSAVERMQGDEADAVALSRLDAEIAEKTAALAAADETIETSEAALEAMKASIIEAMNRLSDARNRVTHSGAMATALNARIGDISRETEDCQAKGGRLDEELRAAKEAQSGAEAQRDDAAKRLSDAQSRQADKEQAYRNLQQRVRELEQAASSQQSRFSVLSDMARQREGYYDSVKFLMRDAANDAALSRAMVGVVAELVRVPKEYETAISMSLGSSLQNIVTETPEDAQYVIEYLRKKDYGRATLLPLSLLRVQTPTPQERALLNAEGCIGLASELITFDKKIAPAVGFLLGRTAIVKDLDSGVRLKKRSGGAFHIATLDGDIISTGGSMSGGSQKKRSFSLLGREREMAELMEAIRATEQKKTALLADVERGKNELLLLGAEIDGVRGELHGREIDLAKQNERTEIILRDISENRAALEKLAEERDGILENLAELAAERERAATLQTDIEQGNACTREDVAKAQQALAALRAEREEQNAAITELRVRRMALAKERDAAASEKKRLQRELDEGRKRVLALDAELLTLKEQIDAAGARLEQMQASVATEQGVAAERKKAQQALEDERAQLADALSALRAQREGLLSESRELTERLHKQEMNKSRLEMELSAMQNHIWEEYSLTYENALPLRREIAIGNTNARIAELKGEIRALGEINVAAIEDYKAVSERHASLSAQRDDLTMAKADLESLIVELTKTMEAEFKKQFALIQQNFTGVFCELFGGGYAELRLADERDALNCEIDIIAQPPGKKLQLLSLLSGGERALTAIALLFAMLRLKPPAFCLLDEIESSLDEANVSRFADFIKSYSGGTQFILITHRKGSMEVCDTLYGVSMEEKGVSKIVSARFEEVS